MTLAFICYALATAFVLLMGLVYAFKSSLMPYHMQAMERQWEDIEPKLRFMLKVLFNGGGFLGLSTGLFMLVLLLIPFKAGAAWAGYAIGGIGLVGALPLTRIVYQVKKNTAGNPPLLAMLILNLLLIAGLAFSILGY